MHHMRPTQPSRTIIGEIVAYIQIRNVTPAVNALAASDLRLTSWFSIFRERTPHEKN